MIQSSFQQHFLCCVMSHLAASCRLQIDLAWCRLCTVLCCLFVCLFVYIINILSGLSLFLGVCWGGRGDMKCLVQHCLSLLFYRNDYYAPKTEHL